MLNLIIQIQIAWALGVLVGFTAPKSIRWFVSVCIVLFAVFVIPVFILGLGLMSVGTHGGTGSARQIDGVDLVLHFVPFFSISFFLTLLVRLIRFKKIRGPLALLIAFLPSLILGLLYLLSRI